MLKPTRAVEERVKVKDGPNECNERMLCQTSDYVDILLSSTATTRVKKKGNPFLKGRGRIS